MDFQQSCIDDFAPLDLGSIDFSDQTGMNARISDLNMTIFSMPQQDRSTFNAFSATPEPSSPALNMPLMMFSSQQSQLQPPIQQQQQLPQLFQQQQLSPLLSQANTMISPMPIPDAPSHGSHLKFPFKLHHILCEAERLGFNHIISWIPSGDGFKVLDPKAFTASIMPKYFGMSHYKSFQRQLSLYSFKRATEGLNKDAYQHPYFHRNTPQSCSKIPREKKRSAKSARNRIEKVTKPCVSTSSSVAEHGNAESSQPQSSHTTNEHGSSWVKQHDHWLSQYVHFLVHGNDDNRNDDFKSFNDAATPISHFSNVPADVEGDDLASLENVTLEDVCDEIVTTFRQSKLDGMEQI